MILGCDTGLTNYGIAVVSEEGEPLYLETFYNPKKLNKVLQDRRDRTFKLALFLERILSRFPITAIAMEMPHRAPSLTGIVTTTLAVGTQLTLATLRNIPVTVIGAKEVRKTVFGNAKIEDEEMYRLLYSKVAVDFVNTPKSRQEHALDAFATARYHLNLPFVEVKPNVKRTRKQLRAPKETSR